MGDPRGGATKLASSPKLGHDLLGQSLEDWEQQICFMSDGKQAFVPVGSPVIRVINDKLEQEGEEPLGDDDLIDGTLMYMVNSKDARECIDKVKRMYGNA